MDGHVLLAQTQRGDQHLTAGAPAILTAYEAANPPLRLATTVIDREGMSASWLAQLVAEGRTVADPVLERLPVAGRLVRLTERYDAARLEAACGRARDFDDPSYRTVAQILAAGLETAPPAPPPPAPRAPAPPPRFRRSAEQLLGHLFGGRLWD